MIILITASLSSNTYNKASWREQWTLEWTLSIFLSMLIFPKDFSFNINKSSRFVWSLNHDSRNRNNRFHYSRTDNPSNLNPVSKEVSFLPIQLIGTNVWLPKTHDIPLEVEFESSRSPAKSESESWNSPSLHYFAVLHTWQYCLSSHVWWVSNIDSDDCHKVRSILWLIVQVCSLTIENQVFQIVSNICISEQFGSTLVKILQQISFLLLWSDGHRYKE